MYDTTILIAFGGYLVVQAVELAAYFLAPSVLSRLAFIPVGPELIANIPRDRLSTDGYRDVPRHSLEMSDFEVPDAIGTSERTVGGWEGSHGWLRAKFRLVGVNRALAVVRLEGKVRGERVHVRARLFPTPIVAVLLLPLAVYLVRGFDSMLLTGAAGCIVTVSLLVGLFLSRARVVGSIEPALIEIKESIERPAR